MDKVLSTEVKFVPSPKWLINSKLDHLNKVALAASEVLESTIFFHDKYGSKRRLTGWKKWDKQIVTLNGVDSVLVKCKKLLASLDNDMYNQIYDLLEQINASWKVKATGENDDNNSCQVLQVIWEQQNLLFEKQITYKACPYTDETLKVLHFTEYCLYQLLQIATQVQEETVIAAVEEDDEDDEEKGEKE